MRDDRFVALAFGHLSEGVFHPAPTYSRKPRNLTTIENNWSIDCPVAGSRGLKKKSSSGRADVNHE
jgi:hypothetical protein